MKARVLCCENCEVRIAKETEIDKDFKDQEYGRKRFARCFNVAVEEDKALVCVRCGHVHYEEEEVSAEFAERMLRTVAFKARPMRVMLLFKATVCFFHAESLKGIPRAGWFTLSHFHQTPTVLQHSTRATS